MVLSCLTVLSSARAETFKCKESPEAAMKKGRRQFAVTVEAIERITDPRVLGQSDYAESVVVTLLSRDPSSSSAKFKRMKGFTAVAKSEDVMYQIRSKKSGFGMMVYMDELEESWMKLKGVRGTIYVNCMGSQHQ